MDTASHVIASLDTSNLLTWGLIAGSLWIGLGALIVGVVHGGAKSDQVSRRQFAAQATVRSAEQITAKAATSKQAKQKVLADA